MSHRNRTTPLAHVYHQLRVVRKNNRWSMGGRDPEGKIHLTFWWHMFQGNAYAYARRSETQSAGFAEMRELIKDAIANHGGVVGGIAVLAEDPNAYPRKVAKAWKTGNMRITHFDESADAFTAVRV